MTEGDSHRSSSIQALEMSKFVPQGGLTAEQEAELRQQEQSAAKSFQKNEDEKERKSLYDQLKENKEKKDQAKEEAFRKKFLAHHVDADAGEFFETLKKEELEKEKREKEHVEKDIQKFRELQQKKQKEKQKSNKPSMKIEKTTIKVKKGKKKVVI